MGLTTLACGSLRAPMRLLASAVALLCLLGAASALAQASPLSERRFTFPKKRELVLQVPAAWNAQVRVSSVDSSNEADSVRKASQELTELAAKLKAMVDQFRV